MQQQYSYIKVPIECCSTSNGKCLFYNYMNGKVTLYQMIIKLSFWLKLVSSTCGFKWIYFEVVWLCVFYVIEYCSNSFWDELSSAYWIENRFQVDERDVLHHIKFDSQCSVVQSGYCETI